MKRRIMLVSVLMSLCVTGIVGLQLYWNYQNYQRTLKTFRHDINAALNSAVNREIGSRHNTIVTEVKTWLRDTSMFQITCTNDNPNAHTVFHLADTYPLYEDQGVFLGMASFKSSLSKITPAAKEAFIKHFADTTLRSDLQKGVVYYYTQRLGRRIDSVYNHSALNQDTLARFYRQELEARGIYADFALRGLSSPKLAKVHLTAGVNTALRRPYQMERIQAGFDSPDLWFLNEMKWLLLTSIVLIGITLFCFWYTVRTLRSQQQLVLLRESFMSNVTHELNTPIASIKITAEALRTFKHDEQTRDSYLEMIGHQSDRLASLANQVLDFEKNNADRSTETIQLNSQIADVIADLSMYSKGFNAQINYHPPDSAVYIKGRKDPIAKVMINLLENAMKYTLGDPNIFVSLNQQGRKVEIIVADHGIGIPAEYSTRIFERFFRVPQGDVHNVKGYGLGLSYVKQIVDQFGGKISVSANQPQGTKVTILFPNANG